jgi:hypothetical protein
MQIARKVGHLHLSGSSLAAIRATFNKTRQRFARRRRPEAARTAARRFEPIRSEESPRCWVADLRNAKKPVDPKAYSRPLAAGGPPEMAAIRVPLSGN